ncbi:hypothetical protein QYM36_010049 [Artemia franciscana]|uniref:Uncharacterized protein n=1 Tax=Artemia franciscana TaxID=6661 RepID=A0AA88HWE0_ARTSF|nr:hypothetical protein QYM36_010049 [Artemia franciscana]
MLYFLFYSDANSADHVAEMLEFTVTTDDADSSRNEGTPVKEEMHDDCATWKQSSQSLPMQCLNLPSGIAQPLNHTNGNVRLLNCQNGMTEALHPPGFPPLRKILPKMVMPEVNSIPYETLHVTPTQVQPVQVDPLGLCLSKDINSLPLDIRAKCISEVYGVISRYVDQSMKKKDDSSPGCPRCRDYIYE